MSRSTTDSLDLQKLATPSSCRHVGARRLALGRHAVHVLLSSLVLLAIFGAEGDAHASEISTADLVAADGDRGAFSEGAATRVRWLFRPRAGFSRSELVSDGGALEVARLARFSDLRILEAPIDSVDRVEQLWSRFGSLQRDERGTAALDRTTALVGAGFPLWTTLGLQGDAASTVAILDSGVDTAHNDLGDKDDDDQDTPPMAGDDADWSAAKPTGPSSDFGFRVVGWHDVAQDLPLALGPYDYHYHGTAVASAAFGSGSVDSRYRGVAPQGRFVVVKTWNFENRWERWASDFLLGVDWVLTNRDLYRIRSCLVTTVWTQDLGLSSAVQALVDAGIAVVCAAGNTGDAAMGYPALVDDVISVGAVNSQGLVASYSTTAPAGSGLLDLVAPGGSLVDVDDRVEVADNDPNDSYRGRVGTSIAAAHVAGAVSILQQATREVGRDWRRDRDQVLWLQSILRATAVETFGAESGARSSPTTDRFGFDDVEGYGLLQIQAAVAAVREVMWVGEDRSFDLTAAIDGPASGAVRLPVEGIEALSLDLIPPPGGDFDLFLYSEQPDGLHLVGRSDGVGLGEAESIRLAHPSAGTYVAVVKRVAGAGQARLFTGWDDALGSPWPTSLLSDQSTAAMRVDLDGDGLDEILLTNDLFSSPTDHRLYALRADGQPVRGFPRFLAGAADRPGTLSSPTVGLYGNQLAILVAGETGELYALDADGGFRFRIPVTGFDATSAVVIIDEGPSAHAVVGTPQGLTLVDTAGAADDTLRFSSGVTRDVAVADLDRDGRDELAVVDDSLLVYIVDSTGNSWPGWPLRPSGDVDVTPPVFVGDFDGLPPDRLAFARRDGSGSAWVELRDLTGASMPGFPLKIENSGVSVVAISPIAVSAVIRGGPLQIVVAVAYLDGASRFGLDLVAVALDGSETWRRTRELARREFDGSFFQIVRARLAEPIAVDWSSSPGVEFVQGVETLWSELVAAPVPRFGSVHTWMLWSEADLPGRDRWDLDEGHQWLPTGLVSTALAGDLDGDGRAELYLPRGASLARFDSRMPGEFAADRSRLWSMERGNAGRTACAGCVEEVVVSTSPAVTVPAQLRASPNPFNPRTTLELSGAAAGMLRWELYDARGRRLRVWTSSNEGAEIHREIFQPVDARGRELASGTYLLRVNDGRRWVGRRLTLVR